MTCRPIRPTPLLLCSLLAAAGRTGLAVAETPPAETPPAAPAIAPPVIPNAAFDVTAFGAVGDGKTPCTAALADAIAVAARAGGGHVVVPAGTFLVGRVRLASGIDLHLDAGATLRMTDDPAAYRNARGGVDNGVTAEHCHDVAITGAGTIDGHGQSWWDAFRKIKGTPAAALPENRRPYLVALSDCERVRVQGVTLTNSPMFNLVPRACTDVTIDAVTFKAPADAPNTDGLDPSGWRYLITRCAFDVGDDDIAIKPSGKAVGDRPSCEDITITDCTFLHGHGLSVGGQTRGGLRRLRVRRCGFDGTDAGIRLKAARGTGGLVEDLSYEQLTMKHVKVPFYITSYYPKDPADPSDTAQPVTATTPVWRDIRISDVTVSDSPEAGRIIGLPEMPVDGVVFTRVHVTAATGLTAWNAGRVRFEQSTLTVAAGPAVSADRAEVTGLPPGPSGPRR